ncbi:hypothetical protein RKD23_007143 [Streptomyces sp. SAI-170]|uniref:DUF6223 family protein n=1 Tax=Streptomyces sp. SAI-170 TaxID=3377729 RepID=UPI003C7AB7DE
MSLTSALGVPAVVQAQPLAADAYTMTAGRLTAVVAALIGLAGLVAGASALARAVGRIGWGDARRNAVVALVACPVGMLLGGLVVVTADGGLGTGNGLGGGIVAVLLGLGGVVLGRLALARSRRTPPTAR